jgi:hypothetical protein
MKIICVAMVLSVALLVCTARVGAQEGASGRGVLPVEPPGTTEPGPPDADRKACPQTRYIDCMPSIGKKARPMCSPEYLRWLKENCPEVQVVY